MIRIFETGDNHIGKKYGTHENGAFLAEERISALKGMVNKANEEECDFFVITGDLFENLRVSQKDIKKTTDILAEFEETVLVLPGNHDFFSDDENMWKQFRDLSGGNIVVLSSPKPYAFETRDGKNVVVYPAACSSKHSDAGGNSLGWIKNRQESIPHDDADFRIGIAHGAIEGETIDSEGRYFLMTRDELGRLPMDLWLIGHTHVPFPGTLTESFRVTNERVFNAGTHVQTDVNCNTPGLCFIIEVDSDKTIRAEKWVSGDLHFERTELETVPGEFDSRLDAALSGLSDKTVLDIIVKGRMNADEYENRNRIIEEHTRRFLECRPDTSDCARELTEDIIDEKFAENTLPSYLLKELLRDPVEAQMAYDLLCKLTEEGGKTK